MRETKPLTGMVDGQQESSQDDERDTYGVHIHLLSSKFTLGGLSLSEASAIVNRWSPSLNVGTLYVYYRGQEMHFNPSMITLITVGKEARF